MSWESAQTCTGYVTTLRPPTFIFPANVSLQRRLIERKNKRVFTKRSWNHTGSERNKHIHTHTHTHKYTHTQTQTQKHTHVHKHTHKHKHTETHKHTHCNYKYNTNALNTELYSLHSVRQKKNINFNDEIQPERLLRTVQILIPNSFADQHVDSR
jgi:hypothetical protein